MAPVKRFSSPIWTFSIPVLAGLLMTWGILHVPFLVKLEHSAFVFPEKFSSDTHLAFHDRKTEQFVVSVYDIRSKYAPASNLTSYTIDGDTADILGSSDLSPANWTFIINSIREAGAKHLVISPSLSWENADELALRAIQHELVQLDSYTIGINLQRGPIKQEFPSYLEGSVIRSPEGAALDNIPEINQIGSPPSIEAPLYGFTQLENIHPARDDDTIKIPLLLQWDGKLLPSIELAALMTLSGVSPKDVLYHPGKSLNLIGGPPIIPIDESGRTSIPLKKADALSAAKILESPEETPPIVALVSENSSLQLQQYPYTIQYLDSLRQRKFGDIYFRLPFWKEAAFLAVFVLILHRRKWWLTAIAALAYFVFPFSSGEWLLFSPPLTAALTFTVLRIRGTGAPLEAPKPSAPPVEINKPAEEPEPSLPEELVEETEESPANKLPQRHSPSKRRATSHKDRLAKKKRTH